MNFTIGIGDPEKGCDYYGEVNGYVIVEDSKGELTLLGDHNLNQRMELKKRIEKTIEDYWKELHKDRESQ